MSVAVISSVCSPTARSWRRSGDWQSPVAGTSVPSSVHDQPPASTVSLPVNLKLALVLLVADGPDWKLTTGGTASVNSYSSGDSSCSPSRLTPRTSRRYSPSCRPVNVCDTIPVDGFRVPQGWNSPAVLSLRSLHSNVASFTGLSVSGSNAWKVKVADGPLGSSGKVSIRVSGPPRIRQRYSAGVASTLGGSAVSTART
jgi:hypothetical protein